jgi:glycosyltransferase involved in cell wall biosynthesis
MSDCTVRGLTSIIIPCWNQLAFTQQCFNALKNHTRLPWELIVIDNGSTDGTAVYLSGVRDMAAVPVTIVSNTQNLGFPAAVNQGLQLARGEYLVLLNNDVVVTDGWLDQLIALACCTKTAATAGNAESAEGDGGIGLEELVAASGLPNVTIVDVDSEGQVDTGSGSSPVRCHCQRSGPIGLVGPMSNYAAPPQLIDGVPYQEMAEMPDFARRWRDAHRGEWFTVPKLSGFCLLMKRAVYEAIGGLDERFGLGFFDDDDLAERARRAGFELAVARDLFVHHFGSRTFVGNGIDAGKLLDQNATRFAEKWGLDGINGRQVSLRTWAPHQATQEEDLTQSRKDAKNTNGPVSDSDRDTTGRIRSNPELDTSAPKLDSPFAAWRLGLRSSSPGVMPDEARPGERARVSLTMIVRDEEENLGNCLASVRGAFDEIIIVDTGSTDRTVEIARSFGARVFEFAWVDSFSAARNEALSHATGDYAFWLDADDVVEPREREKLVALLASLRRLRGAANSTCIDGSAEAQAPSPLPSPRRGEGDRLALPTGTVARSGVSSGDLRVPEGQAREHALDRAPLGSADNTPTAYVVRCACDPSPDGAGGETVVDHVRLFPLRADVRWTYRVHEQILPALKKARVPVRWTDLTVRHTGYVDSALRARKLERDIRLLRLDLQHRPSDPFTLFNLGAIAVERRQWREALGLLERSLAGSAPTDSIVRKLFALIARSHQMLGDLKEALRTCARGLGADPEDAELWFRKGMIHRQRGESAEAETSWRRILRLHRPNQFCSVDQGIFGHVTRRNLAVLAAERGDFAEVERLWQAVLAECPGDREALTHLRQLQLNGPLVGGTGNEKILGGSAVPRRSIRPSIPQ